MGVSFLDFRRRSIGEATSPARGWSTQELAELYRVRDRLAEAGMRVGFEWGQSDEGDPWAVFEQTDTAEIVVHIARIDGGLVVVNAATGTAYRGCDFRSVTDQMLRDAPLVLPREGEGGAKVIVHPRSVLTAFVAAAVVMAEIARNIEPARAAAPGAEATGDAPSEEPGLVGLIARILARDNAGAGFAAGVSVTWGAVAAAMLAADLTRGSVSDVEVAVASAASGSIADPNLRETSGLPATIADEEPVPVDLAHAPPPEAGNAVQVAMLESGGQAAALRAPALRAEAAGVGNAPAEEAPHATGRGEPASEAVAIAEAAPEAPVADAQQAKTARSDSAAAPAEALAEKSPEPTSETPPELHERVKGSLIVVDLGSLAGKGDAPLTLSGRPADIGSPVVSTSSETSAPELVRAPSLDAGGTVVSKTDDQKSEIADRDPEVDLVSAGAAVDAPAAEPETATFTPAVSRFAYHDAQSSWSSHVFAEGVIDVLVFDGREAHVHEFRFGEDILIVNGSQSVAHWIRDVSVAGADVQIVGADGSLLWLHGSYHNVA